MTEEVANYKKYLERRIEHAKRHVTQLEAKQGENPAANFTYWGGWDMGYWKGIQAGYENSLDKWEEDHNGKSTQIGNIPD